MSISSIAGLGIAERKRSLEQSAAAALPKIWREFPATDYLPQSPDGMIWHATKKIATALQDPTASDPIVRDGNEAIPLQHYIARFTVGAQRLGYFSRARAPNAEGGSPAYQSNKLFTHLPQLLRGLPEKFELNDLTGPAAAERFQRYTFADEPWLRNNLFGTLSHAVDVAESPQKSYLLPPGLTLTLDDFRKNPGPFHIPPDFADIIRDVQIAESVLDRSPLVRSMLPGDYRETRRAATASLKEGAVRAIDSLDAAGSLYRQRTHRN